MPKFYGKVGYAITVEVEPGVWAEKITERSYYGDEVQTMTKWENGQGLNDDLNVSNDISIIADTFAYEHFSEIRYVTYMGARWKVRNVKPSRPRLILSIGGVYNGDGPNPEGEGSSPPGETEKDSWG